MDASFFAKCLQFYKMPSAGAEANVVESRAWTLFGLETAAECLDFDLATHATIS